MTGRTVYATLDDMYYTSYTLYPVGAMSARAAAQPRSGVLLRSSDGGYACLQPWTELGDSPLDYELEALRDGNPLRLGACALRCMEVDAEARKSGKNLFEGLRVPRSHATLTVSATPSQVYNLDKKGFSVGKLKLLPRLEATVERLVNFAAIVPHWKWRLDFNCTLSVDDALRLWDMLSDEMKQRIDFIEDPCYYTVEGWQKLQDAGMPLGYDMPLMNGETSIPGCTTKPMLRLVKPALHMSNRGLPVFTSYLDHPLGQCWAAYNAALFYTGKPREEVPFCGLVTQHVYRPNEFSEELGLDITPEFKTPSGTGLGFDKLLEALDWKKLM